MAAAALLAACTNAPSAGPVHHRSATPPLLRLVSPGGGRATNIGPGPTRLAITDAGTGALATAPTPFPVPQNGTTVYPFVATGDAVVAITGMQDGGLDRSIDGTAWMFRPGSNSPPVDLGPTSQE